MGNKLIVISGPSGVGKGSIIRGLLVSHHEWALSISATTRQPRPGEINGRDYFFISEAEFKAQIAGDNFLEWACVHNHLYGTLKQSTDFLLKTNPAVILEIDVQGAEKIRAQGYPHSSVFILPPSEMELRKRLVGRRTETDQELELRFQNALSELKSAEYYNYRIVNNELETAIRQTAQIIENEVQ